MIQASTTWEQTTAPAVLSGPEGFQAFVPVDSTHSRRHGWHIPSSARGLVQDGNYVSLSAWGVMQP